MKEGKYKIAVDLKSALSHTQLDARILRDFSENTNKELKNALNKLLPTSLIPFVILKSGIDPNLKVNSITKEQRKDLVNTLKELEFDIAKFRPIEEAIITSGGVCVNEINPKTMESKLVKGLYFAGEIIDTDAYTGGFNLQIAFSSGYLAANNV
jgi:predicted Rossmann fold flavoprotein